MPETTKEIKITEIEKVSIIFLPFVFVSGVSSGNVLDNVGDHRLPNFICLHLEIKVLFGQTPFELCIEHGESMHRDKVVELVSEASGVRHRDLVAGDLLCVNNRSVPCNFHASRPEPVRQIWHSYCYACRSCFRSSVRCGPSTKCTNAGTSFQQRPQWQSGRRCQPCVPS
jgi:hypothetical protein